MSATDGEREWVIIPLEAKIAKRQGMPLKIPVPKDQIEGLADSGLSAEKLRGWIKEFFDTAPVAKDGNWRRRNSEMVSGLEGFVDKGPLWAKAEAAFAKNDYDTALSALKRITAMCPDDHSAKMNYANALANKGEHDKALKQLKQIKESFGGEPDYHVTVAQVLVQQQNADGAVEELLKALEAKPDHLPAMDALAKLGVLTKIYENPRDAASLLYLRADSVLDYLKEQWDAGDRGADFFVEQLGYHENERRWEVAVEAATRAIAKSQPGEKARVRAEIGRINALRELGRLADATAAVQSALAASPDAAALHVELAKCLRKDGKLDDARAAIDKALACDPGDQEALVVSFWPADTGDMMKVSEAIPSLQKWADQHPQSAGAWRSLARAKLVAGADDEALAMFAKAAALAPDDDDLRSEWWAELATKTRYQDIIDDSKKLGDMLTRDWRLRWNEAEAYRGLGRLMEARGCYMQLTGDNDLHVDIRKRAKRAMAEMGTKDIPGMG